MKMDETTTIERIDNTRSPVEHTVWLAEIVSVEGGPHAVVERTVHATEAEALKDAKVLSENHHGETFIRLIHEHLHKGQHTDTPIEKLL